MAGTDGKRGVAANGASEKPWDALVVGAGPAGIYAALALVAAGVRTLVLDAGPDVRERRRAREEGGADYESGVGGAGLFSDGKLCMSLDVGGHLEHAVSGARRARLLGDIDGVFRTLLDAPAQIGHDPDAVATLADEARSVGLAFKHYPVLHIGTDRCRDVILRLCELLADGGAEIRAHAKVEGLTVERLRGVKRATVVHADGRRSTVRAHHVVLALGKVGAAQEADLCARLGVRLESQPLYVGVRYEAPADALTSLFTATKDPKYSLTFADGSKLKTHCASEHGEVLRLRYGDRPLAGGHNYSDRRSNRSGFSLLWDGYEPRTDSYSASLELMGRVKMRTSGKLLVQRVSDYDRGWASGDEVERLPLTCSDSVGGDVREVLPPEYFERLDAFLERLERIVPGIRDDEAVFYAPAIEWWMKRVVVDERMATNVPGLFACGDGSGWSQGIVHAAATGLLAASGILETDVDVRSWVDARAGVRSRPALAGSRT